jgi:anti-sigma factor RsiW
MSCEAYRDRLIDGLASGESSLDGDVAAHLRTCAECKRFYEAQVHLFGAIDSGVRAMVNETVPASLLPGVRGLVAEVGVPRRSWGFAWGFAAVGVAAVVVIGAGLLRRNPENAGGVTAMLPAFTQGVREAAQVAPVQTQVTAAAPKFHTIKVKNVTVSKGGEARPEVLVLAEERAAFVRFVTDLPEERDVAVALTRPATDGKDEAVEIALLQIDELNVKPLESSNQ